ncbi:MAG TPA: sensor histidine kinase [Terriglobia bacterium]|jgi:signal transduction histidine kinase
MTLSVLPSSNVAALPVYTSGTEDRIALIDAEGMIVGVNDQWLSLAEQHGAVPGTGPGTNYLDVCLRAGSSCADARDALSGIRAVIKGELRSFTMEYVGGMFPRHRRFRMSVTPIHFNDARFVIAHREVTAQPDPRTLKQLRGFARQLMNAQEEERERIAREIHDNLGNRIALLSFSVQRIARSQSKLSVPDNDELNDVIDNITDLSKSLRDISHALHPPLLKHAGLCPALKALCQEYQKTLGVRLTATIAEWPNLPADIATCLFRVAQECLHNIAKHAGATRVRVLLERRGKEIRLTVSDKGRGFRITENVTNEGLGLLSIKERVLCLKGRLKIQSVPGEGTTVSVALPIPEKRLSN